MPCCFQYWAEPTGNYSFFSFSFFLGCCYFSLFDSRRFERVKVGLLCCCCCCSMLDVVVRWACCSSWLGPNSGCINELLRKSEKPPNSPASGFCCCCGGGWVGMPNPQNILLKRNLELYIWSTVKSQRYSSRRGSTVCIYPSLLTDRRSVAAILEHFVLEASLLKIFVPVASSQSFFTCLLGWWYGLARKSFDEYRSVQAEISANSTDIFSGQDFRCYLSCPIVDLTSSRDKMTQVVGCCRKDRYFLEATPEDCRHLLRLGLYWSFVGSSCCHREERGNQNYSHASVCNKIMQVKHPFKLDVPDFSHQIIDGLCIKAVEAAYERAALQKIPEHSCKYLTDTSRNILKMFVEPVSEPPRMAMDDEPRCL